MLKDTKLLEKYHNFYNYTGSSLNLLIFTPSTTTKKGKENASNMPKRTPQERSPCHSSLSLRERPFFSVFLSKIKENMWNK